MKRRSFAKSALKKVAIAVMSLMLVALPAMAVAADDHAVVGAPPVSQPLVTEGVFAVSLATPLGATSTTDAMHERGTAGGGMRR